MTASTAADASELRSAMYSAAADLGGPWTHARRDVWRPGLNLAHVSDRGRVWLTLFGDGRVQLCLSLSAVDRLTVGYIGLDDAAAVLANPVVVLIAARSVATT
ncbi:hypothetical protein [Jiangella muralis]|uniref:hypothetical protein n=1 Tax=Jiangella muralis TaxID=702383 RepID=UPI00069F3B6F|nr:hypothetical protein [Jiangella muralis]